MCGILGAIDYRGNSANPGKIREATDTLLKRGPDDSGFWIEGCAGLGHRRLSILDTTEAGHQPMVSENGRYVIVLNGEIYNFLELRSQLKGEKDRWHSCSDTEVVLAAYDKWGFSCLERFRGMFAFAIWDREEKVLFAARDRIGIKPFYYHYSHECFVFASRPRALFAMCPEITRELDHQSLRLYLECGYIPSPYSIHQGIRKLPPAHYLRLTPKGITLNRYWDFRPIAPESSCTGS